MRRRLRALIAPIVSSIVFTALLTGCGGTSNGLPGGVAVHVGTATISAATVRHWLPIEASLSGRDVPQTPPPRGYVPDPPHYSACIGYEKHAAAENGARSALTNADARSKCRQRWESLRIHTVDSLILYQWLSGEVAALGQGVSEQQARAAMTKNLRHLFKTPAELHRYLASTSQTEADELHRTMNGLLANKVLEQVISRKGSTPEQAHLAYARFLKKWIARTSCARDYIAPDCRQYKGLLPPGT